ncbi:helix-turn-helix domain-containing protein [Bacillus sp. JJ722]|uniref:spr1629 family repressor/antitoxin n=1 Tax=Bacillus sp. JJ722 TaxID=3122973 RepID=UPI002FFF9489
MFVGEKLTNIRLLHGLSRQELATMLEVTEQSIWQYETGITTPKLETINQMKEIFSVRPKYFYSSDFLTNEINENNIAYRSTERSSRKKTKSESIHLEYLNSIIVFMEEYVSLPNNVLLEVRKYATTYIKNNCTQSRDEIIEYLATYTRHKLGLARNNNDNLLFLIEKAGAFVFEKALGNSVDAYSTWSRFDRAYIMLGNMKKSAVRRNFDIAHELGHLVLHHLKDISELEKHEYDVIEKEANLFASNFLMPTNEIRKDFTSIAKVSNPHSYIDIKKKWNVSIAALGYRAYFLNDMDYKQYRYFNSLLNRYNYKQNEPLDDELVIFRPGKIRSLFQYIFENGHCSFEQLLDYTNFEINLFVQLFDIESAFFKKYLNTSKKVFDFTPKIQNL